MNSTVSLITVGPGKEVYSAFGHSALRISDPELGIDNVYNYGTFTFDENFYLNFVRGENDYWLSVVPFQREYYSWAILQNRNIITQKLNFTLKQKNDLYRFLENNALPANSEYRYDYFYDNCSNRIDNALKKVFRNSLKFASQSVADKHNKAGATIRQLTHDYLLQNPWGELGIETCLGIDMDKKISFEQFKFLPDFLMWNYDEAKIKTNNGFVPLVEEKIFLFKSKEESSTKSFPDYFTPRLFFSIILLCAVVFSVPFIHKTVLARLFDFTLFFICGAVGLLLMFLCFFTTHHSQINLNILWANPAGLFLAFAVFSKKYNLRISNYYFFYGLLLVLIIVCWFVLPQRLNDAYLVICLALILRFFANFYYAKTAKRLEVETCFAER